MGVSKCQNICSQEKNSTQHLEMDQNGLFQLTPRLPGISHFLCQAGRRRRSLSARNGPRRGRAGRVPANHSEVGQVGNKLCTAWTTFKTKTSKLRSCLMAAVLFWTFCWMVHSKRRDLPRRYRARTWGSWDVDKPICWDIFWDKIEGLVLNLWGNVLFFLTPPMAELAVIAPLS